MNGLARRPHDGARTSHMLLQETIRTNEPGTIPAAPLHHRFAALDGWRGIAAICVAFYHFSVYSHISSSQFVHNTYLLVDFFFVLSGFVISYTYADRLRGRAAVLNFAIRRFGRLWPLHATVLLFMVLIETAKLVASQNRWIVLNHLPFDPEGHMSLASLPANFFLIQALGVVHGRSWNVPSWSISTEFWTYLVFAALCLLSRRSMTIGAALLALLGLGAVFTFSETNMNVSDDYGFFRCLYGFFFGYFSFLLWRRASAADPKWVGHCEVPVVVAAIAFIAWEGDNILSEFAPLVFSAVVWVFAFESGIASRLLRCRGVERLGEYSYSIYMVHFVIMDLLIYATFGFGKAIHWPIGSSAVKNDRLVLSLGDNPYLGDAVAIVYVAAILLVSALTHHYIETPGRAFFNGIAGKWRTPKLAA
jgi:peptidoglycan/LPS O-acetylase OafA/YrhL